LEAYQLMLRRAFLTVGLPRRITFDHGTVFYDNTSPSPFQTRLHLWLLALGIDVCFTRKRCPTDHAKIERTHQTMTLQALLGQRWSDQMALWAGLDARRAMLNQHIPTGGALGSLLSPRMGSRAARPGARLCVPSNLSLVSAHPGQRAA
jgi:transposase InsO family protein